MMKILWVCDDFMVKFYELIKISLKNSVNADET